MQLDDNFLQSIGLGGLPETERQEFLAHFREQMELRVGTRLSEGLTDEQFKEFESFIDRNMDVVNAWLATHTPDYEQDPVYQNLRANAPETVTDDVLKSEYASLRWLSVNRPNYKEVVAAVTEELKQEIIAHRDAILGAQSEQQ